MGQKKQKILFLLACFGKLSHESGPVFTRYCRWGLFSGGGKKIDKTIPEKKVTVKKQAETEGGAGVREVGRLARLPGNRLAFKGRKGELELLGGGKKGEKKGAGEKGRKWSTFCSHGGFLCILGRKGRKKKGWGKALSGPVGRIGGRGKKKGEFCFRGTHEHYGSFCSWGKLILGCGHRGRMREEGGREERRRYSPRQGGRSYQQ